MNADGSSSDPWAALEQATAAPPARPKPKRERVVLAERRSSRRVVRTLAEVEEQTEVGVMWARQLVRAQLSLAMRLMSLVGVVLIGLPLAFKFVPTVATVSVFGFRLPWLVLGFALYPFFLVVAWSYNRIADRNEQEFTEMVEN